MIKESKESDGWPIDNSNINIAMMKIRPPPGLLNNACPFPGESPSRRISFTNQTPNDEDIDIISICSDDVKDSDENNDGTVILKLYEKATAPIDIRLTAPNPNLLSQSPRNKKFLGTGASSPPREIPSTLTNNHLGIARKELKMTSIPSGVSVGFSSNNVCVCVVSLFNFHCFHYVLLWL